MSSGSDPLAYGRTKTQVGAVFTSFVLVPFVDGGNDCTGRLSFACSVPSVHALPFSFIPPFPQTKEGFREVRAGGLKPLCKHPPLSKHPASKPSSKDPCVTVVASIPGAHMLYFIYFSLQMFRISVCLTFSFLCCPIWLMFAWFMVVCASAFPLDRSMSLLRHSVVPSSKYPLPRASPSSRYEGIHRAIAA